MTVRTYSELIKLTTFDERLDYLRLWGAPHTSPRATSLAFFKSKEWLATRDMIITRDCGFDLGVFGTYIYSPVYVHHINPIDEDDISKWSEKLFDPENLISTSLDTHNTIHYRKEIITPYVERTPNDTKLW